MISRTFTPEMISQKSSRRITSELPGRGDYSQPSIQSIKLRNALHALRSNELLGCTTARKGAVQNPER